MTIKEKEDYIKNYIVERDAMNMTLCFKGKNFGEYNGLILDSFGIDEDNDTIVFAQCNSFDLENPSFSIMYKGCNLSDQEHEKVISNIYSFLSFQESFHVICNIEKPD